MGAAGDLTCSAEINSACAKVLTIGQNACTAQMRRRPEGRSFRAVNIQIDLAFQKERHASACLSFGVPPPGGLRTGPGAAIMEERQKQSDGWQSRLWRCRLWKKAARADLSSKRSGKMGAAASRISVKPVIWSLLQRISQCPEIGQAILFFFYCGPKHVIWKK